MAKRKIKDAPEEEELLSAEELSKYIKDLSSSVRNLLLNGHISRRAILLLVHDALPTNRAHGTGYGQKICSKKQINAVLETIMELEGTYCV